MSKFDQNRTKDGWEKLHKQTDKQTDTTKIMVTWPWTNYTDNHLFRHTILENQIQGLSRTFSQRFKNFEGPCLFSMTFKALKIWQKLQELSRTLKDQQEPCIQLGIPRRWSVEVKQFAIICSSCNATHHLTHRHHIWTAQPHSPGCANVAPI